MRPVLNAAAVSFLSATVCAAPAAAGTTPRIDPPGQAHVAAENGMEPYTELIPGTAVRIEMVPIRGGTFTMGSAPDAWKHQADEGPPVRVKVEPFWMGRFEIRWKAYEPYVNAYDRALDAASPRTRVAKDGGADAISTPTPPWGIPFKHLSDEGPTGDHPVVCVTQFAAKQYTKWLSKKTGRFYRLPTEAEWEYACRAGTRTPYSFGEGPAELNKHAWHAGNAAGAVHPVGTKRPNPWGLHDMHGNAAELVIDQYDAEGYQRLAGRKQPVPAAEAIHWPGRDERYGRVLRGGSWRHGAAALRSAVRLASKPAWQASDPEFPRSIWWHRDAPFAGFRIVRPLAVPKKETRRKFWRARSEAVRDLFQSEDRRLRIEAGPDADASDG